MLAAPVQELEITILSNRVFPEEETSGSAANLDTAARMRTYDSSTRAHRVVGAARISLVSRVRSDLSRRRSGTAENGDGKLHAVVVPGPKRAMQI
jgi:hypothetical protein